MATNKLLEDHVTCPVCKEIYDDPHSLECRHIICLPCLNQLKERGRVECPVCREQMPFKKIKRDFKTKNLADSFKKEKEAGSKEISDHHPNGCDVCKVPEKAVVSRCKTCDTYLCQLCLRAHKGVRVTKNHVLESEAEIIVALQVKAGATITKSKKDLDIVEKSRSDISASITLINEKKKTLQTQVNVRIDHLIRQLENRRAKLKYNIIKGSESTLDTLTENMKVFDEHKALLEDNIGCLSQLSTSNDLQSLMAPTATVTRHLSEQSKDIDDDLCRLECNIQDSPLKVVNGLDYDVNTYVTVHNGNVSYADLMKMICVEEEKEAHLSILNMCMINDELWCCGGDHIRIFNRECTLEREITFYEIKNTKEVAEVPNGDVIVACEVAGLHQLNSQGEYVCQILEGNYTNVSYYNNLLYALYDDGYFNKVYVFENEDSYWVKKFEWDAILSAEFFAEKKMFVNRYGVFLSSLGEFIKIHLFSHQGKLIQRAGRAAEEGELAAGMLKNPVLFGVDSHGIAFVGDYFKHTFQLYNSNDCTWQIIMKDLKSVNYPLACVLDGNNLFISTAETLWKYKLIEC